MNDTTDTLDRRPGDTTEALTVTRAQLRHLARAAALEALYENGVSADDGGAEARRIAGESSVGMDSTKGRARTDKFIDEFLNEGPCPACVKG